MEKQQITERLRQLCCRVCTDEPMSAHTSFRIGGPADWFVTVSNEEQLTAVLALCRETQTPVLLIGNGSNLLVSDEGIAGAVVQLEPAAPVFSGTTVIAPAGLPLGKLCVAACEKGLSGLEFAYGIPGTVGGGVYMNAGAYGGELCQVIRRVTVLLPNGQTAILDGADMNFGYRHSRCMDESLVVLSAELELRQDDPAAIRNRMDEYLARRRDKQPLEYPSGGSFFKRPPGHFAGALIEQCGLKGFTVGGAQVSEKHAGFVINRGGATCADVMELCRRVQRNVKETYGVQLEREVQHIGR